MARSPIGAVIGRPTPGQPPTERAQTLLVAASGPVEEVVRLVLVLLAARDFTHALWAGLGWATVEVVFACVNSVVLAGLLGRDDRSRRNSMRCSSARDSSVIDRRFRGCGTDRRVAAARRVHSGAVHGPGRRGGHDRAAQRDQPARGAACQAVHRVDGTGRRGCRSRHFHDRHPTCAMTEELTRRQLPRSTDHFRQFHAAAVASGVDPLPPFQRFRKPAPAIGTAPGQFGDLRKTVRRNAANKAIPLLRGKAWKSSKRSMVRPASVNRSDGSFRRISNIANRSSASLDTAGVSVRFTASLIHRLAISTSRAPRLVGTTPSPRPSRSLTSRTVPGEIPATLAISRSEASGLSRISSLASLRPSAGSIAWPDRQDQPACTTGHLAHLHVAASRRSCWERDQLITQSPYWTSVGETR